MRSTFNIRSFRFTNPSLKGWPTGQPQRGILHTQGNPGAAALNALKWGNRTGAFSIHWYVQDRVAYRCISETRQAFHAKQSTRARARGYPTTRGRGDTRAIGIEHVETREDVWSQETRITSVLLGAAITRRYPWIAWSDHSEWDPRNRPDDTGNRLYVPDWIADVYDVIGGREPWRTVTAEYDGSRPAADRGDSAVDVRGELQIIRDSVDEIERITGGSA